MKIGLVYVKGAVPAFEDFGYLPTHLVKQNGLVEGQKAHNVLDGLIIPGGSIVESESISPDLAREIKLMDKQGKFILGICSGFQVIAQKTDIGRKSPCPIEKKGLGLVDVTFHPMISNDRVEARIVDDSFLTRGLVGEKITGFHCHTYGHIEGDAPPVFYSKIKRTDYADNPREVLAGVKNDEGNVVGTMVHGCLDDNPSLVQNILDFLDAGEKDISQIKNENNEFLRKIKGELGIDTGIGVKIPPNSDFISKSGISSENSYKGSSDLPLTLMLGSTGSDSGKTFLGTGLAAAFRKKGLKVAILKVGPDIRDIVPALYMIKEKMEQFSSIKIGHLGWMELQDVLKRLSSLNYDLVLIEGVMSVFTGILNEKVPYSSAEIALAGNIPVLMISGCSKGGIETAAVDITAHARMMQELGIEVPGIILNRVYDDKIFQKASSFIKNNIDVQMIEGVPKIKMSVRGATPEVEIKLEEFCLAALNTVEENLDLNKIFSLARKPRFDGYRTMEEIEKNF